jgi:hypothetical protein
MLNVFVLRTPGKFTRAKKPTFHVRVTGSTTFDCKSAIEAKKLASKIRKALGRKGRP